MDVIAAAQGLASVRTDIGAEVAFIGALVGREAYVTIEAVSAVLRRQM